MPTKSLISQTNALQKAIFNNPNFSSIATDVKGVIQLFNVGAEKMLGYTAQEVINKLTPADMVNLSEIIIHAKSLSDELKMPTTEGVESLILKASLGIEDSYTLTFIRKNGTPFPVIVTVSALRCDEGTIIGYLFIITDNSTRHHIENNVRQREEEAIRTVSEYSRSLIEASLDSFVTISAEGKITDVNNATELATGVDREYLIGSDFANYFTQPEKASEGYQLVFSQGTVTNYPLVMRHISGREIDVLYNASVYRGQNGDVLGIFAAARDITERKKEEALLKEGALQNAIFNSANFSSIATDAKGVIQIFNVGAERMLGYTAIEVMNKITPADISDPKEVIIRAQALSNELGTSITPGFEALVFKASRGIEDIYELTYIRKDGSRFPAVVSVTALRDDEGSIIGYLLIGTDNTARKQYEEALLKADALQSAIFNSANFSSIATDAKGVIQIFNVGAEKMLGYEAADVMNKITPADISDPQEVITRAQALSNELGTSITPGFEALVFKASRGIEDIYELTYIRKDGSRFPAVVSVTALRDAQGIIIGYLLIGTDNTARKQAEEALIKAGALQSAIFNSANFSSIATDAKGVIQIFNVGAEKMLGYEAADVMNKITPADISDPQEVITRAQALSDELGTSITPGFEALVFKASRGIEDIYELTYIRKDGSRFPAVVSVTALRDIHGAIIGYLLIGTDNTIHKQIEAEQTILAQRLRDQQFYTRSLFESNIDALITTDPSGIITDVNKQMEVLTGCTRDELIGAPFKDHFTHPEQADAGIRLVINHKKITNYVLTARSIEGKETVVSYNATTFYDRNRKLQGVFGAARDITELKRLDQVLREKNIELENATLVAEKANLAKSDFLSSMSHELRSPLNAILGFAELIESDPVSPTPSQKASLAQIVKAGWHLLTLINEILDLAKVESRQMPLSIEAVSLSEVILECKAMVEPLAKQQGIKLSLPVLDDPYFVDADRVRLKQVFINLMTNAIKYNRPNGTIVVACTHFLARTRISITDTGFGLSPEKITQLFQAFNRLGRESKSEEGTGIGLVVSKRMVELMGGTIGVESTVGVGSVFWFELASISEPLQMPLEKHDLSAISSFPIIANITRLSTLLYVEDNPANLQLVEQIVERHPNMNLLTAINGNTGVQIARKHLPDVILMDINLPDISGYEALEILKHDSKTAHIPIIAVSANAMPGDIKKGMDAGFFRYITKPIRVNELIAIVSLALESIKEPMR